MLLSMNGMEIKIIKKKIIMTYLAVFTAWNLAIDLIFKKTHLGIVIINKQTTYI